MKKILITFLFIISSSIYAGAAEPSKTTTVEDPDLKLSIEELRKKYPIDWLEKNYGDINLCPDLDDPEPVDVSENLVCNFHDFEYSIENFSEKEIKSIVVNTMNQKYKNTDFRIKQIAGIIFKYFNNKRDTDLTKEEKKLKKFIYSKQVMKSFQGREGCTIVKQSNHLDICPE